MKNCESCTPPSRKRTTSLPGKARKREEKRTTTDYSSKIQLPARTFNTRVKKKNNFLQIRTDPTGKNPKVST